MPFYRYECEDCGFEFKILHVNGNKEEPICPQCGSTRVRRLLPRIGVVYKGSGYYNTDYRKKSKAPSGSGAESKKKEPASDTKADA